MTKRGYIINIIIFIVFNFPAFSDLTFADSGQLLFSEIIEANTGIISIDAEIIQYINTPEHSREVFKGKYIADNSGRFRIDYSAPSRQIVLNDGKILHWYYPEENVLYIIGNDKTSRENPKINPLQEFRSEQFTEQFQVDYSGKHLYGFFKWAYKFIVKDRKNNLAIHIEVDSKSKVVLSKVVKDIAGAEIIKEVYDGYERIKEVYVPGQIDVYARTNTGIARNTTKYSNIRLNYTIPDTMFKMKFPKNVKKKYLYGE